MIGIVQQIVALKREALLSSPLLDFDRLLLIRWTTPSASCRPRAGSKTTSSPEFSLPGSVGIHGK